MYPQSFYDSNGDGIGDLQGIIQKLNYIKSLGVDAVWINPFFESPFGDGGYDISDYYTVAARYGTNDDAKMLFGEAHKRGLKILFDFVASYSSREHPWFKESSRQGKNKYSNWYIWTDNIWINPPKNFEGAFIKGYGTRNGQYMQNFYYSEPALNYGFASPDPKQPWELPTDHPDVLAMREEMKNVCRFWLTMGADGFRADMAGALVKSSGAAETRQFYSTQEEETKRFWREIRDILKKDFPEAFIVSEWSYPASALDGCFHADFFHWFEGYNDLFQKESWRILNGYSEGHSYFDEEGKGDVTFFLSKFLEQYNLTKGKGYISLPLGNHDNARLGNKRSKDDLEIIYAFGLTMPGSTVYLLRKRNWNAPVTGRLAASRRSLPSAERGTNTDAVVEREESRVLDCGGRQTLSPRRSCRRRCHRGVRGKKSGLAAQQDAQADTVETFGTCLYGVCRICTAVCKERCLSVCLRKG